MRYLTLIRHGQTTGDIEDRFGGDYEDHLTDLGKQQSTQLARELLPLHIEKFFVSSRFRAQETAFIIESVLQIDGSIEKHLRERNSYGILTGVTKEEAQAQYPEECELVKDYKNCIQGAESYEDFKFRVIGVYNKMLTVPNEHIGIISHAGVIRCLFREVFHLGEIKEVGDCGWVTIDLDGFNIVNASRFKI